MAYLQDLHSARVERLARMSAPLPGSQPRRKPVVRTIHIVRGEQQGRRLLGPPVVTIPINEPQSAPVDVPVVRPSKPATISVGRIMAATSAEFGVDVTNRCRTRPYVVPRQIAMYLARKLTGLSLPRIGRRMGGYDHTTVLHGIRKGAEYAAIPRIHAARVTAIEESLRASS